MKYQIIIDESHSEEVLIYAHEPSALTRAIAKLCEEDGMELIGYREREMMPLPLSKVACFIVEDNKIYGLIGKERWLLKCRLYQLEERLPSNFVKINQSSIANIKQVERFDASISGTLQVKFKNDYIDYVSRRCMKNVKERLGL